MNFKLPRQRTINLICNCNFLIFATSVTVAIITTHLRHQKPSYATGTNISEEHTASTFVVEDRRHVSSETTRLHGTKFTLTEKSKKQ